MSTSPNAEPECTCSVVPEHLWTTHYGAVDPATMLEPDPQCRVHFTDAERELNSSLASTAESGIDPWTGLPVTKVS